MRITLLALAVLVVGASPAPAQLPDVNGTVGGVLNQTPDVGDVTNTVRDVRNRTTQTLQNARQEATRTLRRLHGDVVDQDGDGWPVIRNEVVAVAPTEATLNAARAAGFSVSETIDARELGLTLVVLTAPQGLSTRRALERLREIDPQGAYDYNHIYLGADVGAARGVARPTLQATQNGGSGSGTRIGLIDGGVNMRHPAFANCSVEQRGFAGAQALADAHGTAVASLLENAAPGASLYIADIYGGRPNGGGASAIVSALAWLAQSRVGVINLSLVGPPNRALEAGVRAAIARGHVIVAAVGNDGPSAPPLYPASYPGVIGVTGVDARNRALPEAGRGDQVDFAAPGSDMNAAGLNGGYAPVRGTSYASPIVAALIARNFGTPDAVRAAAAAQVLARNATDLGARGRDPAFGAGLVGAEMRNTRQQTARR